MIEIACGPLSEPEVTDEIPFVCSLFLEAGAPQVSVMYGVGCNIDHNELWSPLYIPAAELLRWIAQAAQMGIYKAGRSDIFIDAGDPLTVRLCHEGDIHVSARSASIFQKCASRWLEKEVIGYCETMFFRQAELRGGRSTRSMKLLQAFSARAAAITQP